MRLLVGFAAVANPGHGDCVRTVVNLVQDAPVAHAHAPSWGLVVMQQPASRGTGISAKRTQGREDALCSAGGQSPDVALRRGRDNNLHQRSFPSARRRASISSRDTGSPLTFFPSSRWRMSLTCSAASMSSSYSSRVSITPVRWPFSSTTYCRAFFAPSVLARVATVNAFYRDHPHTSSKGVTAKLSDRGATHASPFQGAGATGAPVAPGCARLGEGRQGRGCTLTRPLPSTGMTFADAARQ